MQTNLIKFALTVVCIAFFSTIANAQNLTAAQMNIYFGHPKKVTVSNSQGVVTTEFDREGKITGISQGNMRMVYDWASDGKNVTLSMYQGQNIQDSGNISITTLSKSLYKYTIGGVVEMSVVFKENGAVEKLNISNPQMSTTMTYFYHNSQDIYPYAIEQSMGDQAMKLAVTINKTDSYGNAIEYTQEAMGMKDVSHLAIEYY